VDCDRAATEELIERYLRGDASEEDRTAFEEHYFHCERCFDELKTVQLIADELRRSEVELERPFLPDDVEVVVEQCDQTLQRMQRTDHDHGNAGEDDRTDGQTAPRLFTGGRGHTQPLLL